MLAEVLSADRRAARLIVPFMSISVVLRLVVSALVLPLASLLLGLAIATSDRPALTDQDILRFLLTPAGLLGVLAARAIGDLTGLDTDFIAVNTGQVSAALLDRAHRAGKRVYVWAVNDPLAMSRVMSMGVDGLITDDSAFARRVIAERDALSAPERLLLWLAARFRIGTFRPTADERDA